jgi:hypothetical protein
VYIHVNNYLEIYLFIIKSLHSRSPPWRSSLRTTLLTKIFTTGLQISLKGELEVFFLTECHFYSLIAPHPPHRTSLILHGKNAKPQMSPGSISQFSSHFKPNHPSFIAPKIICDFDAWLTFRSFVLCQVVQ